MVPLSTTEWRVLAGRYLVMRGYHMRSKAVPIENVQDLLEDFGRRVMKQLAQERDDALKIAREAVAVSNSALLMEKPR